MKIGIVSPFNPYDVRDYLSSYNNISNINKSAIAVSTLVRALIKKGHCIKVFTSFEYGDKCKDIVYKGDNIEIYVLNRDHCISKMGLFSRFYMVKRLQKIISLHVKDLDILHAHWTYDFALAAKAFKEIIPVFCTVRDWCPYIKRTQTSLNSKIYWEISSLVFKKVMSGSGIHFIANSDYTYDCIKSSFPDKNISVIFNPIDEDLILRTRNVYPKNHRFISITGGINLRKNIEILVAAFQDVKKLHPSSQLYLVGGCFTDGNPEIIRWREKYNFDGIILCGWADRHKLIELLDNSLILVHPSLEETFGNILLEGMARRVAVIGGEKSGAVPSVLGRGKYGMLCDVTNKNDLVKAMCEMTNKNRWMEYIDKSTHYIISTYSSDVIADKHLTLYKTCIKKESSDEN